MIGFYLYMMDIKSYTGLILIFAGFWSPSTEESLFRIASKRHNPKGLGDPASHLRESRVRSHSRPSASNSLPIVDLVEEPDAARDPKDEDLNYKTLRSMMRRTFDSAFMSVMEPNERLLKPNGTVVYKLKKGRPKTRMPKYIKSVSSFKLANGRKMRLKLNKRTKQKVQRYLWSFNYCPVQYTWKDLGIRFWPRWIREGVCYSGRSCSIPPGMTCRPHKEIQKVILRWQCRSSNSEKLHCKWIRIHYPIIDECKCAC